MKREINTKLRKSLLFLAAVGATLLNIGCKHTEEQKPVMLLRLSIDNTVTDESWAKTLSILNKHPECCDEIWFSTGIGIPPMEVHQQHAERLVDAKQDLEKLGISTSLQVQMTIGHGDQLGISDEWSAKRWTGWTGSTGVECKYCNCPRQPELLEYMREMTRLYARIQPRILWVDDDLRYDNHKPATQNSRIGCWCETCLAEFSAREGKTWSRVELDKAMATDKDLEYRWMMFSLESLQQIAHIIAEETVAVSPSTKMGYQKTFFTRDTLVVKTILKELAEVSGQKVAYRPGGSAYYDRYHPVNQIVKSMDAARFIRLIGSPDYVESWCPEVESYPRHYGSRSGQSVLLEGFAALAYGMDAVSMFVMDHGEESPELQARSMLKPLEEGSDVLRRYAQANIGTEAVGFRANVSNEALYDFGVMGIPILPGEGRSLGTLEKEVLTSVNLYSQPSSEIQAFRDKLNADAEMPVLCCSPFVGLVMPRVDAEGNLRTLGLINSRIDVQGPILFSLASVPEDAKSAIWYELRKKPVKLNIQYDAVGAFIEIPQLDAWNAGFLEF